jgi:NAD+ synthase
LELDWQAETDRVAAAIREAMRTQLRRKGAVVGLSGGIDSSVVAALCVRALGADRVLGLFMPEADSEPESLALGNLLAKSLGIRTVTESLTSTLAAMGCYQRRDDAIRTVIPEYGPDWKCKIVLPGVLENRGFRLFSVVARAPDGREVTRRLPPEAYFGVVASTNFKQRLRATLEYYHADRLDYAVAGTPNRLEYDQGFFVKNGDGAADFKPIAHLYKTQVYRMAAHLGVPDEIRRRPPTTDTYSLPQSQDEFFFSLPYGRMDLCLYAHDHGVPADVVAGALGLTTEQAERVFADIESKRRAAHYLHLPPLVFAADTPASDAAR